ncbi:hypothetical protein Bbelb_373000 [Branchiostoma belcheri]|nr:hypothetical protein Bbelb_373000 [Branchiostoma belcheri]
MSNVTPYLSSCVLLFCQPVFSDHYTAHIMYEVGPSLLFVCYRSSTAYPAERPNRAKEHSSRDGDEHNMHDEKITPLAMCVTTRLPLPECTKEHSSRDSDEHNMHDEISHHSPCVLPLDCPYPSVPKNTQAGTVTNTTCTTKDHTAHDVCCRSTAPTRVCQRTLKQGQ